MVRRPGNVAVVTGAAVCPRRYPVHVDVIRAGTHFETEIRVTNTALIADTMKPVRKDHRSDAFAIGIAVEDDVGILGLRNAQAAVSR